MINKFVLIKNAKPKFLYYKKLLNQPNANEIFKKEFYLNLNFKLKNKYHSIDNLLISEDTKNKDILTKYKNDQYSLQLFTSFIIPNLETTQAKLRPHPNSQ